MSLTATRDIIIPAVSSSIWSRTGNWLSPFGSKTAAGRHHHPERQDDVRLLRRHNCYDAITNLPSGATVGNGAVYSVGGTDVAVADGGTGASTASGRVQRSASRLARTFQAYSANLATWAGVAPSANGQSLVAAANYAAMRGLLDLEAGTDFPRLWRFPARMASRFVGAANYAAMRALLDLEAGTDFIPRQPRMRRSSRLRPS